jgi:hypothetical protein
VIPKRPEAQEPTQVSRIKMARLIRKSQAIIGSPAFPNSKDLRLLRKMQRAGHDASTDKCHF